MAERVTITRDDGELGTIDASELDRATASGFRVVQEDEAAAIEKRRAAQSTAGMAIGTGEALARGVTMGAYDPLARALGADMEASRARQENLGTFGAGAELVGAAAPALFTGGTGLAGTAARLTPAGIVARTGLATERAVVGATRSRVLGAAAQGGVEGFVGGLGMTASQDALGDRDLSAERMLAGGVEGLGVGALFGAGIGGTTSGLERAAGALGSLSRPGATLAADSAAGLMEGVGASGGWVERAATTGGRVLGAGDPEAFGRSFGRLRTAEGRGRILGNIDEAREASAVKIKGAADEVNAALDDAIRLTQGKGKLREIEKRMAGVDNAIAPRHALSHIDDQQASIRAVLDEAGDTISAEMRADLRKAMRLSERSKDAVINGKTGAAAFQAVDDLKRELDVIARKRRSHAGRTGSPEIDDAASAVENLARTSRQHLEIEEIYGGGARLQRDMNAALSGELRAVEKLGAKNSKLRSMFKRGEEADTDTALALARLHSKAGGASKASAVDDVLDARLHLLKTARSNYDLPPEVVQRFDDAERSIEGMRAQLRDQAETASALDDAWKLREVEGNKSPSITAASSLGPAVGGLIGASFGGPLGAAIGTAVGYATRPYTLLRGAAGVLNQVDRLAQWKRGVDGVAAREASITAGFERLADGGRAAARASSRAARLAAVGAGKEETKGERQDRLLAVRDSVLASDPIKVAEDMQDRVAALHDLAPDVARAVVERSAVAVQFLASKVPNVYQSEFGSTAKIADPAALDRFDRYVTAVQDPLGAVEKISRGVFDAEAAEALRVVYPKIYAEVQGRVLEMLGRRKQEGRPTSHEARVQLGLLLEMPLDDSLRPGFLSSAQSQQPPPVAGPAPSRPSKPIEITGQRTDLGRLESGELRS